MPKTERQEPPRRPDAAGPARHGAPGNAVVLGIADEDCRLPPDWDINEGDAEIAAELTHRGGEG